MATTTINLGLSLDGLSNVDSTGKATGDVLEWNSVSGNWEAVTPSGGGGGLQGIHTFLPFPSGNVTSAVTISVNPLSNTAFIANRLTAYPYIPAQSFTASNIFVNVTAAVAGSLCRIAIYSDLNGYPDSRLFVSSDLNCSTTGQKTALTTFNFVAGTTYWLAFHSGATTSILTAITQAQSIPLRMNNLASAANSVFYSLSFSTPTPSTFLAGQFFISQNLQYIGITKA